jgi:hypothetical protein
MHYLNVISSSQNFLQIKPPVTCTGNWRFEDAPLAVATDSILFVTELAECVPTPGDPHAAARFKRARIRLRLDEYDIDGYVHVPPGGDPIARLNQDRHTFIALTAVTVVGPDTELTAPFLAACRTEILAMQILEQDQLADEESFAEVGAGV